jgi:hypothetical protein
MLSNPWIKLVLQVGVPAAVALFLVFQLSTKVDHNLDVITATLHEHTQETRTNAALLTTLADRSAQTQYIIVDLLRAQCVNAATTYEARQACLVAGASR